MIQTLSTSPEVPQDIPAAEIIPATEIIPAPEIIPAAEMLSPSTHPPVILPAGLRAGSSASTLGFAPAPPPLVVRPVPAKGLTPLVHRRRLRAHWYQVAVILLLLGCAAFCVYRLAWAIHP